MSDPPEPAEPRISVICPVHTGAAYLDACLTASARSSAPILQVIVVDDASTDRSAEIAAGYGAEVVKTAGGPLGPGAARNTARRTARGEYLVFVDADVVVRPDAIERLVEAIREDAGVAASFGSYDEAEASTSIASKYGNLRHHFVHQTSSTEASTFWAGCGAVRAADFDAVGGFNARFEKPSIEDIDMGLRLHAQGRRIRLVHEAQATHLKIWTVWNLWKTDILCRAVPWSRLMVTSDSVPADLNTRSSARVSALLSLAWIGCAGLAWIDWRLGVGLAVAVALVWVGLNADFLRLLRRVGGVRLCLGGALLHWAYYVYASLTFAYVALAHRLRRRFRPASSG